MNRRLHASLFIGLLLLAAAVGLPPAARGGEDLQEVQIGVLAKRGVERCLEK